MLSPENRILVINDSSRRLLRSIGQQDCWSRVRRSRPVSPRSSKPSNLPSKASPTSRPPIEIVDGAIVRPIRLFVNRITDRDDSRMLLMLRDETEARRVEEMRREFIANISHELKTPLAAIKGYAETVEAGC